MENTKNITDFIFELGALKNVKRSGWWIINVKDPENVAEHSFRSGVVGHFLAKLEKVDANKVALMSLFNDLHEARLNDLHKIGHRYIDFRKAEMAARQEQAEGLGEIGQEMLELHKEFMEQKTKESIVARDADLSEVAFQAKEYIEIGYKDAQDWIDNVRKGLVTESAKKMHAENLKQRAHKEEKLKNEALEVSEKLKELTLTIGAKTSSTGKIFGSVNTIQIAEALNKQGIKVERKNISLADDAIKQIGKYQAKIKLHKEVITEIEFEVVSE